MQAGGRLPTERDDFYSLFFGGLNFDLLSESDELVDICLCEKKKTKKHILIIERTET